MYVIYEPRGQAGEYAELAVNPYRGCGHKCAYCYVPLITKQPRAEFDAGASPRPNFLQLVRADARTMAAAGDRRQVMLSFTTDPYHPGDTTLTRQTLETFVTYDIGFCTLTKGGKRALRDLDLFRPHRDAFAATLTCVDETISARWERGAAPPSERMTVLRAFHQHGIFTWVSLEPTLDADTSIDLIMRTHEYVDLYKIGRANYLPLTRTTDWRTYTLRIIEVCQRLGVKHYIKRDLQPYLPDGYINPMRVPQHHGQVITHNTHTQHCLPILDNN